MAKIQFEGKVPVPHEELLAHIEHSRKLGFPYISSASPHGRPLAIVGGGPSADRYIDEIGEYKDIWAINGACGWLRDNGIDSTLLSLDPCDFLAPRVSGAKKAILSSRCHPKVFEELKGCDISLFDVIQDNGGGVWASVSTASVVFHLATELGYRNTVFYGCEGSYTRTTHLYMDDKDLQDYRFVVAIDGKEYLTAPDLYEQTKAMAPIIRTFKKYFTEKCGGLLRAMIKTETHEIVKVSRGLLSGLKPSEPRSRCQRCGSQWHTDCAPGVTNDISDTPETRQAHRL